MAGKVSNPSDVLLRWDEYPWMSSLVPTLRRSCSMAPGRRRCCVRRKRSPSRTKGTDDRDATVLRAVIYPISTSILAKEFPKC
jgi:hypothetical protein